VAIAVHGLATAVGSGAITNPMKATIFGAVAMTAVNPEPGNLHRRPSSAPGGYVDHHRVNNRPFPRHGSGGTRRRGFSPPIRWEFTETIKKSAFSGVELNRFWGKKNRYRINGSFLRTNLITYTNLRRKKNRLSAIEKSHFGIL
jgi:hypothetical protein